jgi:hypothetical protein
LGLVQFVLQKWVWFTLFLFCTNGFGSVRFARVALIHCCVKTVLVEVECRIPASQGREIVRRCCARPEVGDAWASSGMVD